MAAATVDIRQLTGAGPTATAVTTPRLSTSDSAAPGTSNRLPKPKVDFNFSYWMSLQLTITAMNDSTLLNNYNFYSDGTIGWTLGTGGKLVVGLRDSGDNGCPSGSYDQAGGTEGTTGYDMEDDTNGHDYYKGQDPETGLVSAYTSGAQLTVDTADHAAAEAFDHIVLQAKVADDATAAVKTAETMTFQWDEI